MKHTEGSLQSLVDYSCDPKRNPLLEWRGFDGFCYLAERGPLMVEAINWLHDNDIMNFSADLLKKHYAKYGIFFFGFKARSRVEYIETILTVELFSKLRCNPFINFFFFFNNISYNI